MSESKQTIPVNGQAPDPERAAGDEHAPQPQAPGASAEEDVVDAEVVDEGK